MSADDEGVEVDDRAASEKSASVLRNMSARCSVRVSRRSYETRMVMGVEKPSNED